VTGKAWYDNAMPATKKPIRKPFKIKVHLALRYILRFHQEDGEYEAWCIDAGAVGLGDTQQAALQDLITNLEVSYEQAEQSGHTILTTAREDEERLFAQLAGQQIIEPSVLGYGVIRQLEIVPAGGAKAAPARFEIGQHTSVAV
jgi:hypothetical protein